MGASDIERPRRLTALTVGAMTATALLLLAVGGWKREDEERDEEVRS